MTTVLTVRLPDELVAFLDQCVAKGIVASRAAMVSRALEREMRRQAAMTDALILASQGADDDLDDLVAWTAASTSSER
ncbi:MAG: hypothetical protein Q4C87_05835 [Actinomycetaceae bacterium]|nr:hypothetical protein [Actinomycetaceae bacterium]